MQDVLPIEVECPCDNINHHIRELVSPMSIFFSRKESLNERVSHIALSCIRFEDVGMIVGPNSVKSAAEKGSQTLFMRCRRCRRMGFRVGASKYRSETRGEVYEQPMLFIRIGPLKLHSGSARGRTDSGVGVGLDHIATSSAEERHDGSAGARGEVGRFSNYTRANMFNDFKTVLKVNNR